MVNDVSYIMEQVELAYSEGYRDGYYKALVDVMNDIKANPLYITMGQKT